MSATLSKDLRKKHGVRSMPIRKDDEVSILKGKLKFKIFKIFQKYPKY
jgi:large subunit ribosomal protein L26e